MRMMQGVGQEMILLGDGRVTRHMMQGVHLRSGVWVLSVLYAVCRGHIVQCVCKQLDVFCAQCAVVLGWK
jgi:hypothetical protein